MLQSVHLSRRHFSRLQRARFFIEFVLVQCYARYVRLFPRWVVMATGSVFGRIAYLILWPDRRVAMANLDLVLGTSRTIREKRRIAIQSFSRIGQVVLGLFWSPRLNLKRVRDLVDTADVECVLRELEHRRKGIILVTAHYGDWELACAAMGWVGFPLLMIAEPLANPWLDRLFDRLRTHCGNRTVPPKFALLKLFRALRQGQRVAIACDVNGRRGRGGVWVNFFDRQVFNGVAVAELALRTNAAVLFAAMRPMPRGRWRIEPRPLLEPSHTSDRSGNVKQLTQQIADLHAELLRQDPEPWLWTYKRWKRLPTPDADGYPFYSRFARVE